MKLFDECSFLSYIDILTIETLMFMCDKLKGAFKSFWQDCNYDIQFNLWHLNKNKAKTHSLFTILPKF